MKNVLYKIIKVVHALLWFPLSPIIGPDFPQRFGDCINPRKSAGINRGDGVSNSL